MFKDKKENFEKKYETLFNELENAPENQKINVAYKILELAAKEGEYDGFVNLSEDLNWIGCNGTPKEKVEKLKPKAALNYILKCDEEDKDSLYKILYDRTLPDYVRKRAKRAIFFYSIKELIKDAYDYLRNASLEEIGNDIRRALR